MTNDQPKAPMSAEEYIKANGYRFETGERMIMLKLLKDFAAQTYSDKQSELDNVWSELKGMQSKYEKVVADKQAEIDQLKTAAKELYRALDLMLQVYWPIPGNEELTYAQEQIQENSIIILHSNTRFEIKGVERRQISERTKSRYEKLKAKADKMKEILKRLDPMLITDYLQDIIDEAIQEYESVDK